MLRRDRPAKPRASGPAAACLAPGLAGTKQKGLLRSSRAPCARSRQRRRWRRDRRSGGSWLGAASIALRRVGNLFRAAAVGSGVISRAGGEREDLQIARCARLPLPMLTSGAMSSSAARSERARQSAGCSGTPRARRSCSTRWVRSPGRRISSKPGSSGENFMVSQARSISRLNASRSRNAATSIATTNWPVLVGVTRSALKSMVSRSERGAVQRSPQGCRTSAPRP